MPRSCRQGTSRIAGISVVAARLGNPPDHRHQRLFHRRARRERLQLVSSRTLRSGVRTSRTPRDGLRAARDPGVTNLPAAPVPSESLEATAVAGENGGVIRALRGRLSRCPLYGQAGVRGESLTSFGVLGISRDFLRGGRIQRQCRRRRRTDLGWPACTDTEAVCGMGTLNVSGTKSLRRAAPDGRVEGHQVRLPRGPEAGTYFRGRAKFYRGLARIADARELPHGHGRGRALASRSHRSARWRRYAVVRIDLDEIVVKASRNVEFFYLGQRRAQGLRGLLSDRREALLRARAPRSYKMPESLSTEAKRKLIANGTYNADGTREHGDRQAAGLDRASGRARPRRRRNES